MIGANNGATHALGMTRIKQTLFGDGNAPPAERGNCYPACLASLLGLDSIDDVPHFYGPDNLGNTIDNWWQVVGWLQRRGLTIIAWDWPDMSAHLIRTLVGGVVIFSGESPRFPGTQHAVLGQIREDGKWKLIHDPHPDNTGIMGEPSMVELLVPQVWPTVTR